MANLRDFTFGIEIETASVSRQELATKIAALFGTTARFIGGQYDEWRAPMADGREWAFKRDSSITSRNFQSAEIVSPVLTYADIETTQRVAREARKAGANVNNSCGVHIHVGAAGLSASQVANVAKIVYGQEEYLVRALGVQAHRLQTYTRPTSRRFIGELQALETVDMDRLNQAWFGSYNPTPHHYDQTRYHGLNLHSVWFRQTIEFRYFEATLHAGKLKAYIQLVLAIVAKGANVKTAKANRRTFNLASSRYDFRVWLLRLGLIGDEFETARLHLLANLVGPANRKVKPASAQAPALATSAA